MAFDFSEALSHVHKSLTDSSMADTKSISDDTLAGLAELTESLKNEKLQKLLRVIIGDFVCSIQIMNCTF